jgi:hypothetical protein
MDAWVDRYEKSHQNRVFHTFRIPMIAVSIPLFLIAPEDFGKFRCRCLRQVGFAKCLDTSSQVSHPNSSKTGRKADQNPGPQEGRATGVLVSDAYRKGNGSTNGEIPFAYGVES